MCNFNKNIQRGESKRSQKERSTDVPSWLDKEPLKKGENGNAYATRKMNEHYGEGKWRKKGEQGRDYSKIRKWADRH